MTPAKPRTDAFLLRQSPVADVCAKHMIVTMTVVIVSSAWLTSVEQTCTLSPQRETLSYCLGTHRTGGWETALGRSVLQATVEGTASGTGRPEDQQEVPLTHPFRLILGPPGELCWERSQDQVQPPFDSVS